MKIAVDPGHGMGNSERGVYDPGAVRRSGGETYAEADIVLKYGLTLKHLLHQQGVETFMTRTSSADPAAAGGRASRAERAGCTHFVSLHLNSYSKMASGLEVLYRDVSKDRLLAAALQEGLLQVTGFRDRGVKERTNLAVLKFRPGPAALIELGFINNPDERAFVIDRDNRILVCQAIVEVLSGHP
jgi:N-acetylmuramoyl-L-alanine amidase